MATRKILWAVHNKEGKFLGAFPTKKRLHFFIEEEDIIITKLIWNGVYYSENPLEYDPFSSIEVKTFVPMF